METLKEKFEALAHRIQSSGKPAAAMVPSIYTCHFVERRKLVGSTCCANMPWTPMRTKH